MSEELKFAIKLAKDTGKIIMDGFDKVTVEKSKADRRDVVTNIDLKAEKMIIRGCEGYFDLTGKEEILDMASGIIITKEAGAKITGLDGKYHGQDTSHLVITNGKIHNDFLKLLNRVK